jgi:hypothetical protein
MAVTARVEAALAMTVASPSAAATSRAPSISDVRTSDAREAPTAS